MSAKDGIRATLRKVADVWDFITLIPAMIVFLFWVKPWRKTNAEKDDR